MGEELTIQSQNLSFLCARRAVMHYITAPHHVLKYNSTRDMVHRTPSIETLYNSVSRDGADESVQGEIVYDDDYLARCVQPLFGPYRQSRTTTSSNAIVGRNLQQGFKPPSWYKP
jgi:hypothetical protein